MKQRARYDSLKTQGCLWPMLLITWGKHRRGFIYVFFQIGAEFADIGTDILKHIKGRLIR